MNRLPDNMRSMLENRKKMGTLTSATSAMSIGARAPTLKEERDAIVEDKPKHSVLKAYFDKVIARECADEEEFEE